MRRRRRRGNGGGLDHLDADAERRARGARKVDCCYFLAMEWHPCGELQLTATRSERAEVNRREGDLPRPSRCEEFNSARSYAVPSPASVGEWNAGNHAVCTRALVVGQPSSSAPFPSKSSAMAFEFTLVLSRRRLSSTVLSTIYSQALKKFYTSTYCPIYKRQLRTAPRRRGSTSPDPASQILPHHRRPRPHVDSPPIKPQPGHNRHCVSSRSALLLGCSDPSRSRGGRTHHAKGCGSALCDRTCLGGRVPAIA